VRIRLATALAGLALLVGAARAEEFPPTPVFSDVRVDVRPLMTGGGAPQAQALAADLTAALRQSFAGRLGGNGPKLVVVITGLSLRDYVGNGSRFGLGGTQSDYLEGDALLVGRRGEILGRHHQLTATPSSYGGAWYDPASERRRLAVVADIYAQWLARDLPRD
jgi:hypothetical protein